MNILTTYRDLRKKYNNMLVDLYGGLANTVDTAFYVGEKAALPAIVTTGLTLGAGTACKKEKPVEPPKPPVKPAEIPFERALKVHNVTGNKYAESACKLRRIKVVLDVGDVIYEGDKPDGIKDVVVFYVPCEQEFEKVKQGFQPYEEIYIHKPGKTETCQNPDKVETDTVRSVVLEKAPNGQYVVVMNNRKYLSYWGTETSGVVPFPKSEIKKGKIRWDGEIEKPVTRQSEFRKYNPEACKPKKTKEIKTCAETIKTACIDKSVAEKVTKYIGKCETKVEVNVYIEGDKIKKEVHTDGKGVKVRGEQESSCVSQLNRMRCYNPQWRPVRIRCRPWFFYPWW